MILPDKYVQPKDSIFYMSTILIKKINNNKKISIIELWSKVKKENNMSYIRFVQIVTYLYIIGFIKYNEKGEIYNENYRG